MDKHGILNKIQKVRNTTRRDHLRNIENKMQLSWEKDSVFEADVDHTKEHYMVTFPYPYMNGSLHLGHAFTITKADFTAGYKRLKGYNVLFPFAFHCTGMPIQAAANRLKREIIERGDKEYIESHEETKTTTVLKKYKSGSSNKSKIVKKTGNAKTQWDILKMCDIPTTEIPDFQEPKHWLGYFPPLGEKDLRSFGLHCDWRRSFITTSDNPFYDRYIQWQFNRLREQDKIRFGKRPTIYSILDGQACSDHDRTSGEGIVPQEYTLIKLRILELPKPLKTLEILSGKSIFLIAATLRPETMYGQTNCFVLPTGDYGAYLISEDEVFICSERSIINMSYQDICIEGKVNCLGMMKGIDLMGIPVSAPLAQYDTIYTLPLLTISMDIGTGIVTSVPSDAPDDYIAFKNLKKKQALREKYGITEEMVKHDIIPIINIPGYSNLSAETICNKFKIKSQNDIDKLKKAKHEVYLKGYNEGVMIVGEEGIVGSLVSDVKNTIKQSLIDAEQALIYYEPEQKVVSRSGDECIVALLDQWYICYGDGEWKKIVKKHISNPDTFDTYNPIAFREFQDSLDWLGQWACSRSFGLGTKVPWDKKFVIESLSDSTIYMAYYTISHMIQNRTNGSYNKSKGIVPEQLTDDVFNYIFLRGNYTDECTISEDILNEMRESFEYWYPMNLRVSGKDLIKNHLIMSLYNHVAIWGDRPELWPRSFYTNGHIQVEATKMSKSLGNFITLDKAIKGSGQMEIMDSKTKKKKTIYIGWSSDSTRIALAEAGDGLCDSNFSCSVAEQSILKLTNEEMFIKESLANIKSGMYRDETYEYNFQDKVFDSRMNSLIQKSDTAYKQMRFRDALKYSYHEFSSARDSYRDACKNIEIEMHSILLERFIKVSMIILSPICPHFTDYIWTDVMGNDSHIFDESWPETLDVDITMLRAAKYIDDTIRNFRQIITKERKKNKKCSRKMPDSAHIVISNSYPEWKKKIIRKIKEFYNDEVSPKVMKKELMEIFKADPELNPIMRKVMETMSWILREYKERGIVVFELVSPFNEIDVLEENSKIICITLGIDSIEIFNASTITPCEETSFLANACNKCIPGKPSVVFT